MLRFFELFVYPYVLRIKIAKLEKDCKSSLWEIMLMPLHTNNLAYRKTDNIILLFLFLLTYVFGFSANVYGIDFNFRNISYEHGMNSSVVYKAIQDKDGVMWFALHDGIDKYNGYDFKHYTLHTPDHPFATNTPQVRSLLRDQENNIWAFSDNGLFRYNYLKDRFELVLTNFKEDFQSDQINVINKGPDQTILIGMNNGVLIYDLQKDTVYQIPDFAPNVLSFYSEQASRVWIGTGSGLFLYDIAHNNFVNLSADRYSSDLMQELAVFSYLPLNESVLLLGTRRNGLIELDRQNGKLKKITIEELANLSYAVRDIARYGDQLLLGTDGAGLVVLDLNQTYIERYVINEDLPRSLSNNGIYDLFIDTENRLWISTFGGGVNLFDPKLKAFSVIQHQANNPNSLIANMGRAILEDSKNRLWFGTENGISILDSEKKYFRHIGFETGSPNDLSAKTILCMIEDAQKNIYVGTFSGGINIYNEKGEKTGALNYNRADSNSLSTDYIYTLYLDHDGDIWSGGIRGGICRYTPSSKRFQRFDDVINVKCIRVSSEGLILAGSLNGFYYKEKEAANFSRFEGRRKDSSSFVNRLFCVHEDMKGRIWLGSEGEGLGLVNLESGTQTNFSVKDGLPSNIVYGILEDRYGMLWISTTNGLSRFDPENRIFTNFSMADGLPGKEFNYGAYYKTRDNTFIFGGNRGFTLFNPDEIVLNEKIPDIIFTNFHIYDKENTEAEFEEQRLNVNETGEIILHHDQNSFSIEFAALNYTSTEKNLYRWKLEGLEQFENSWTYNSNDRTASFTGLPHGNYLFKVQGSNNDGYWNNEGRILKIEIKPPFGKTTLAKVFYVLAFLVVIFLIQRYIFLFLKERHSFEKIRFFINIAHDIRTPLTLIKAPVQDMLKKAEKGSEGSKNLELISNNTDKLNNLINQLLDFQKADLDKLKLKISEENVPILIKSIISNFESLAHKSNKSIHFISENMNMMGWCDRFILERVMYNLISNAIKYSNPGSSTNVSLHSEGDFISISVADEGIGISREQQKNIFKRYYRAENSINSKLAGSGVGLMLTKRLTELHKGKISFLSKEGVGTTFKVKIPVKLEYYNNDEICEPQTDKESEKKEILSKVSYEGKNQPLILIAEDNDELREFLKDNLSGYFRTVTAANGKEGLEIINHSHPDLIISDIMMPEMDGVEFCINIRKNINTSHIPIILLTALNSMQDKIRGLEYGADDYIEKPFDIDYLKARIDNLLQSRNILKKKYINQPDENTLSEIQSRPDRDLLKKAYDVVEENYHDCEFSVEHFCRIIGVSRPVLYRKLKAYTDLSPQDFIKVIRLKKAEELLISSSKSVKEIAYEVGFSDPRYFSVSFKKYFGKSPKEFIQS